jgi:geranylgeranylglycerol-phosphate geranylgeranyltransferase
MLIGRKTGGEIMGRRWIRFVELPRPYLFVIPAAAGVCGVFLSCENPSSIALTLGTFIPVLAWAGGQVFNDFFDIDVDKLKHPEWPIPSGDVSKQAVVIYGLCFYIACLILAAFVNLYCLSASLLAITLGTLYGYSGKLKRKGIFRNFCFGLAVATCILIGSTIGENVSPLIIAVIAVATLIYTSDNIIGRLPDIEIDRKMNIRTLPLQIGSKPAAKIAFLLTISAVCITMFLWLLGLHISYLPTAIIASLSLMLLTFSVFKDPEKFGILPTILSRYMGQLLLYMSLIIGATGR